MPSVALIGPDGAGKTTIARMLEGSELIPFKYLYMGINISSSNLALPTSRLVEHLKSRLRRTPNYQQRSATSGVWGRNGRKGRSRRLWAAARLLSYLAEEWYRQGAAWYYQLRGYTVLYDRHFVLDFAPEIAGDDRADLLSKRVHRWCLMHLYPRPDLVIFLDAPGEVLFARKGELTVEELERRRQAFLRQGERLSNFVRVDAVQPLETVYDDVTRQILHFCRGQRIHATSADS